MGGFGGGVYEIATFVLKLPVSNPPTPSCIFTILTYLLFTPGGEAAGASGRRGLREGNIPLQTFHIGRRKTCPTALSFQIRLR